jgi:hypothetical protein
MTYNVIALLLFGMIGQRFALRSEKSGENFPG